MLTSNDHDVLAGAQVMCGCSSLLIDVKIFRANNKLNVFFTGTISPPSVIPTPRKPKCSDNICEQECQDSPTQGAQCSCRDGYRLKPDSLSCQGRTTFLLDVMKLSLNYFLCRELFYYRCRLHVVPSPRMLPRAVGCIRELGRGEMKAHVRQLFALPIFPTPPPPPPPLDRHF